VSSIRKYISDIKHCLQESLPTNVSRTIENEYSGNLIIINKALTNIETAIHYLNAISNQSEADGSLQDFMHEKLKINDRLVRHGKVWKL